MAFNAPSLAKFGPTVHSEGMIIYDSSVISGLPDVAASGVKLVPVPFTAVAGDLGAMLVKNVVALGALQGATRVFPEETFLTAIRATLKQKYAMIPLNEEAFKLGAKLASEQVDYRRQSWTEATGGVLACRPAPSVWRSQFSSLP